MGRTAVSNSCALSGKFCVSLQRLEKVQITVSHNEGVLSAALNHGKNSSFSLMHTQLHIRRNFAAATKWANSGLTECKTFKCRIESWEEQQFLTDAHSTTNSAQLCSCYK